MRSALAQARKARGWSLRAAGREVSCSASMLLMIERGDRIPGLPLAGRIADAYALDDVTRHHLLLRSHWLTDANRDPTEPDRDEDEDLAELAPAPAGPVVHWDTAGRMVAAETSAARDLGSPPAQSVSSGAAATLERVVEL